MPNFDRRMVSVQTPGGPPFYVQLFHANANRVSLIVTSQHSGPSVESLLVSVNKAGTGVFYLFNGPVSATFPYRDYGPIIKEEIWVSLGSAVDTITGVEVFQIPGT